MWSNHWHLPVKSAEQYFEQNYWRNGKIELYECVSTWKAGKEADYTLGDLEQGGWRIVDIEKTNFGKGVGSDLQIMWVFERVSTPELAKERRDAMSI